MESAGVRYLRTRCFCIRNLTRSLRSLVRFLTRQQLVRKYRTPALSMKYSLYIKYYYNIMITIILARFPLSSEVRGLRVVLYEFLGGDVSLGLWNP